MRRALLAPVLALLALSGAEAQQLEAHQPEAHQSEAHQPEAHQPEAHQPEAHQPEAHQPEAPRAPGFVAPLATTPLAADPLATPFESAFALSAPRALTLPAVPRDYLAEAAPAPSAPASPVASTGRHFGASFGGVLLGAMATGAIVGTVSAFENHDGRGRDLALALGGPLLLTAGATWALHRLAEARGEHVRLVPVVVGALLSAGGALAGVFVATSARDQPFVGHHWAWAAPAVALATGFGAWLAHRLSHGARVQPSVGVSNRGVAAHLRVGFRR